MANTPYFTKAENEALLADIRRQYNYESSKYRGYLAIADTPTLDGWYWATQIGTYTNASGLVTVANKINMIEKDGVTFRLNAIDVPITPVVDGFASTSTTSAGSANNDRLLDLKIAQGIPNWTAKAFLINDEVSHLGKLWQANNAIALGDVPGTSSKWVEVLNGYLRNDDFVQKNENEFLIVDNNGNVIFKVDSVGLKSKIYNICDATGATVGVIDKALFDQIVAKINEGGNENIIDNINYTDEFLIIDALSKVGLKYDGINGFDVAKVSDHFKSLLSGGSIQIQSTFTGDYSMNIVYGQSLAVGGSVVNEDFYTSKSFTNGVKINHNYASTTEANNETTQQSRFLGITDMSGSGDGLNARVISKKINEMIVAENDKTLANFNHNQFGYVAGISGGEWYQLTKWNEPRTTQWVSVLPNSMPTALAFGGNSEGRSYLNLVQGIYFANKFAKAQGKKLTVATLSYIQGEAASEKNNTVAQFKAKLNALFDDIKLDVTTITGQSEPIKFLTYQNHSFALYNDPTRPEWTGATQYTEGVPLACLEITKERTDTYFGTTLYPYGSIPAPTGDLIHLPNNGYALMASMLGIQAKRVVNDETPQLPLYPRVAEKNIWQSGIDWFIYLPFDVVKKPLVFDISDAPMSGHGLQPNYGFKILNGSSVDIVTAVTLSSDDAVIIKTNANPTGLQLTYAITGAMGGGNLRDSQGDTITTQFAGITYRCDNWCPFFRITI